MLPLREFTRKCLRLSLPHRKPSGRAIVRVYLRVHILPAFGRMSLDRTGEANRALEILRVMRF